MKFFCFTSLDPKSHVQHTKYLHVNNSLQKSLKTHSVTCFAL